MIRFFPHLYILTARVQAPEAIYIDSESEEAKIRTWRLFP
jgi:hypothetical protein